MTAYYPDPNATTPSISPITGGPRELQIGNPTNPGPYSASAMSFIAQIGDGIGDVPTINLSTISTPESPRFLSTDRPTLDNISWTLPGFPTEFNATLDTSSLLPEPFDADPPTLLFPPAPTADFGSIPDAPGVNMTFDDPTLEVNLPAPPELLNLNVSKFDGIQLPEIDADLPEFTVSAPTVIGYEPGQAYSSALLTALKTELQDRIQNGGTGLNPDVEGAIWDRAREREYKQAGDAIAELERMEGMGFHMPPGVYMDARIKVQTELAKNNAGHSREVMIKQAELELESVQRALDTAQTVEATAIQYTNQVEQRAFDSVRYATEAGVSIYNAKVQAYASYIEAYRTKVAIYEAQVRSELARVEAYRTEIAAEEAKAQINRARVDQFRVMTDAALSAVEVYKAEIAGVQTKADIERLKIQTFGEQVRAYGSQVNAYTASVEGFRASVGAEATKQDAYQSAVGAYGARVTAGSKAIDARIAEYQAQLSAKETEWQGYTARASAEAERVRAISAKNDAVARLYGSEASANNGYNEVLARQWTSQTQSGINAANLAFEAAKANAELYVTHRSLATDAAKVGATVSAQLGSAAISSNNFSTSVSRSQSDSFSESLAQSLSFSESSSTSRSRSDSKSEQYIYSASV